MDFSSLLRSHLLMISLALLVKISCSLPQKIGQRSHTQDLRYSKAYNVGGQSISRDSTFYRHVKAGEITLTRED